MKKIKGAFIQSNILHYIILQLPSDNVIHCQQLWKEIENTR